MRSVQVDDVRAALALPDFDVLAAQRRMAPYPRPLRRSSRRPGDARRASVLILLFPAENGLSFVLTRRSTNPHDVHSGQISLPGGSQEPGETAVQTALREAQEEIGFAGPVQVLGELACLYIPPSDFEVRPVVAYAAQHPRWVVDVVEVAEVLECPVIWLLDDAAKVTEDWTIQGQTVRVPWYRVQGHKVWGATAIILSEFEQRLRLVSDAS